MMIDELSDDPERLAWHAKCTTWIDVDDLLTGIADVPQCDDCTGRRVLSIGEGGWDITRRHEETCPVVKARGDVRPAS